MTWKLYPLLLIVLAACGGNGDDGSSSAVDPSSGDTAASSTVDPSSGDNAASSAQMVTSADGMVTLDIPAGALPADVEVTIELAEPSEGSLVAYEFLPDGLVFAQPATLRVEVALDEATIGEPVRPVRPAWLSSDGTEDESVDFTISGTEGGILVGGEISHFTRFELIRGEVVTVTQLEPGEFVELDSEYRIDFSVEFTSGADLSVNQLWLLSGQLAYEDACSPEGPHRTPGIVVFMEPRDTNLVDNVWGVVVTSATTTCVAIPDVTELTLLPIDDGGEVFAGPVLFRTGADGGFEFGFPVDQVPDGGTLGLGFEGADQMYFGQCNIERRGEEPSVCVVFDRSGLSMTSLPVIETIEGDTIWMGVPAAFLDPIAGTMGVEQIPIGYLDVARWDNVGASQQADLDLDEIADLAGATAAP